MADFCNTCIIRVDLAFYEKNNIPMEQAYEMLNPDIDVFDIFEGLMPGYIRSGYICEGCGLTAIKKTEDGELRVAYWDFGANPDGPINWVEYPDYRKKEGD